MAPERIYPPPVVPREGACYIASDEVQRNFVWRCNSRVGDFGSRGACYCGCGNSSMFLPNEDILREATPEEIMRAVL